MRRVEVLHDEDYFVQPEPPVLLFNEDPDDQPLPSGPVWGIAHSPRIHNNAIKDIKISDLNTDLRLAEKIQTGKTAKELLKAGQELGLSQAELAKLWAQSKQGTEAKWQLVTNHLRFAAYRARLSMGWLPGGEDRFNENGEDVFRSPIYGSLKRFSRAKLPLEDRIQLANLGLIQAAEGFKPDKRRRFTTYCAYSIDQAIARGIEGDKTIHIPIHIQEQFRKLARKEEILTQELGRIPSEQELAKVMEIPISQIGELRLARAMSDLESVDQKLANQEPNFEEEPLELLETIHEPIEGISVLQDAEIHEQIINEGLIDQLMDNVLRERYKFVLAARFGMISGEPWTLEQIGAELNITRERVRQIEHDALKDLRYEVEKLGFLPKPNLSKYDDMARESMARSWWFILHGIKDDPVSPAKEVTDVMVGEMQPSPTPSDARELRQESNDFVGSREQSPHRSSFGRLGQLVLGPPDNPDQPS